MIPRLSLRVQDHLQAKIEADPDFRFAAMMQRAFALPHLVMLSGMQGGLPTRHHGFSKAYEMLYDGQEENRHFLAAFQCSAEVEFHYSIYHQDGIQIDSCLKNERGDVIFVFRAAFNEAGAGGGIISSTTLPIPQIA